MKDLNKFYMFRIGLLIIVNALVIVSCNDNAIDDDDENLTESESKQNNSNKLSGNPESIKFKSNQKDIKVPIGTALNEFKDSEVSDGGEKKQNDVKLVTTYVGNNNQDSGNKNANKATSKASSSMDTKLDLNNIRAMLGNYVMNSKNLKKEGGNNNTLQKTTTDKFRKLNSSTPKDKKRDAISAFSKEKKTNKETKPVQQKDSKHLRYSQSGSEANLKQLKANVEQEYLRRNNYLAEILVNETDNKDQQFDINANDNKNSNDQNVLHNGKGKEQNMPSHSAAVPRVPSSENNNLAHFKNLQKSFEELDHQNEEQKFEVPDVESSKMQNVNIQSSKQHLNNVNDEKDNDVETKETNTPTLAVKDEASITSIGDVLDDMKTDSTDDKDMPNKRNLPLLVKNRLFLGIKGFICHNISDNAIDFSVEYNKNEQNDDQNRNAYLYRVRRLKLTSSDYEDSNNLKTNRFTLSILKEIYNDNEMRKKVIECVMIKLSASLNFELKLENIGQCSIGIDEIIGYKEDNLDPCYQEALRFLELMDINVKDNSLIGVASKVNALRFILSLFEKSNQLDESNCNDNTDCAESFNEIKPNASNFANCSNNDNLYRAPIEANDCNELKDNQMPAKDHTIDTISAHIEVNDCNELKDNQMPAKGHTLDTISVPIEVNDCNELKDKQIPVESGSPDIVPTCSSKK